MIDIHREILSLTAAKEITGRETVQSLWSGYGDIVRYQLTGGEFPSIIVKHIELPKEKAHPRGWNTALSHERKLKSYQVEAFWYKQYAHRTDDHCRVPRVLKVLNRTSELLIIMEDLDTSGYNLRLQPEIVTLFDAKQCLTWLANFHANFLNNPADGLWSIGTYWHLDTRPDEYNRMANDSLKIAAKAIDQQLNEATYQTLVHGDAKLANFCFGDQGRVAAVDFQYVGKGCGMKDVAYFISSCFDEEACEKYEDVLLNHYFDQLEEALINYSEFQLLKSEWGSLYKYAWADFYRFLKGWSPGHWKMHGYSEQLTKEVVKQIEAT